MPSSHRWSRCKRSSVTAADSSPTPPFRSSPPAINLFGPIIHTADGETEAGRGHTARERGSGDLNPAALAPASWLSPATHFMLVPRVSNIPTGIWPPSTEVLCAANEPPTGKSTPQPGQGAGASARGGEE